MQSISLKLCLSFLLLASVCFAFVSRKQFKPIDTHHWKVTESADLIAKTVLRRVMSIISAFKRVDVSILLLCYMKQHVYN